MEIASALQETNCIQCKIVINNDKKMQSDWGNIVQHGKEWSGLDSTSSQLVAGIQCYPLDSTTLCGYIRTDVLRMIAADLDAQFG